MLRNWSWTVRLRMRRVGPSTAVRSAIASAFGQSWVAIRFSVRARSVPERSAPTMRPASSANTDALSRPEPTLIVQRTGPKLGLGRIDTCRAMVIEETVATSCSAARSIAAATRAGTRSRSAGEKGKKPGTTSRMKPGGDTGCGPRVGSTVKPRRRMRRMLQASTSDGRPAPCTSTAISCGVMRTE